MPDISGRNALRPIRKLNDNVTADKTVICDLAWSPDGNTLASCFRDGTIVRWKTAAWSFKKPVQRHESWVKSIDWSCDSTFLVSGSRDQSVCLWNVLDNSAEKYRHGDQVEWVACSPAAPLAASGARDGTVCFWNMAERKVCHRCKAQRGRVTGLAWSPDGRSVAVAFQDQLIEIWDTIELGFETPVPHRSARSTAFRGSLTVTHWP